MAVAFTLGAATGLALLMLARALWPRTVGLAERVTAIDLLRWRATQPRPVEPAAGWAARLGARIAGAFTARGWVRSTMTADLDLLGRSVDQHFAAKSVLAVYALAGGLLLALTQAAVGGAGGAAAPVWLGVFAAALAFTIPDLRLHAEAERCRREFRHVLACYDEWVGSCLAAGRGVTEAMHTAAREVSDHWALRRITAALEHARVTRQGPWVSLDRLGEQIAVPELRDLAGFLALAAEDGARVRRSLEDQAGTLGDRELADLEGKAGRRSQSLNLAQVPLALAFLLFLIYPAISRLSDLAG